MLGFGVFVAQSRIAKQTRSWIATIIFCDLKALDEGSFPSQEVDGNPWPPMSKRQPCRSGPSSQSGGAIKKRTRRDMNSVATTAVSIYIRDWCLACNNGVILNSGDFRAPVAWHQTEEHTWPAPHANDVQVCSYTRRRTVERLREPNSLPSQGY